MRFLHRLRFLFRIGRGHGIARRYFITNGFDGALAMLGLLMGFAVSDATGHLNVWISACLGTAIALCISGMSSAYISETAEKRKELQELEKAMVTRLDKSAHGKAARMTAIVIALINGLSPLLISLAIITPLWLGQRDVWLPLPPLECAILIAFILIFAMGVFLGKISGTFWLWTGLRALAIAIVTTLIILMLSKLPI